MTPTDEWHLNTAYLGNRVFVFDRLDSTNSFALSLANDAANDGLVIVADEQTAGRGQHGRQWSCPGGSGVLMSVLLFPPPHLRRPAILTSWAAVSVCELILKNTGLKATIKWPNDVLIDNRKVCGILIEQKGGTVAGIGLNVNQPAEYFVEAGLPLAASLGMLMQRQQSTRDVARQLIAELDTQYGQLFQGDTGTLERKWAKCLGLAGQQVRLETSSTIHHGLLLALTFEALTLLLPDGTTLNLTPETVRHLYCHP
ncbi:MAG TPA: biotin--[acetyl-CoA-carboxylase] ligase [Gemmataceae bacterium]|nr:biotin--[acetyl-CoA-carboxylase] ligase [Gemmataceae bacterium]